MPKIQLIRKDSSVIELDAADITFDLQRQTQVFPLPFLATRYGIDLNQTAVSVAINGIFSDDV